MFTVRKLFTSISRSCCSLGNAWTLPKFFTRRLSGWVTNNSNKICLSPSSPNSFRYRCRCSCCCCFWWWYCCCSWHFCFCCLLFLLSFLLIETFIIKLNCEPWNFWCLMFWCYPQFWKCICLSYPFIRVVIKCLTFLFQVVK